MKKFYTLLIMLMTSFMAQAMSYSEAREQALYLTDKMAYELNLNQQQYNDCYEINLDYMLNVVSPSDAYGTYLDYRNSDLRSILHDWQYDLFIAADYFMRPLAWLNNAWSLAVYRYYDRTRFFYSRPTVFDTYRGGHSRHFYADGFYINRRPDWNGGLRGIDRPVGRPHSTGAREHRGYRIGGPISSPRGGVNPQRHSSGPGYSIGSSCPSTTLRQYVANSPAAMWQLSSSRVSRVSEASTFRTLHLCSSSRLRRTRPAQNLSSTRFSQATDAAATAVTDAAATTTILAADITTTLVAATMTTLAVAHKADIAAAHHRQSVCRT